MAHQFMCHVVMTYKCVLIINLLTHKIRLQITRYYIEFSTILLKIKSEIVSIENTFQPIKVRSVTIIAETGPAAGLGRCNISSSNP